ncbi:MAG: ribosomal protein S18-alanine N-acetyltransferase [Acidimicrobiia bacterium]|nr:ribosomal protein S18-alanine N-acetyltransferase [Acidimicrobiia bacterium]NNC74328.1 ribosomal protein S18-alanine N-acetyltransferase [Acidimicrobiia bacterium]
MARSSVVTTPVIRSMTSADLTRVLELESAIFPQPWSPGVFRDELALDNRRYLVASVDENILGYAGLMLLGEDAHVTTVAASPDAGGMRLGTRLVLELVEMAMEAGTRHLTLEVRFSNERARELYRRFGFAPVGLRKNYYRTEDALVMWATDIDVPEYADRIADIRRSLESSDE